MSCHRDFALTNPIARRRYRNRPQPKLWTAMPLLLSIAVCACAGCRSASYTARSMPVELQAPPLPATTGINLERMSGDGVGSSQIGAGDLVAITIVSGSRDERVIPVPARVAQDGTVTVPLVGPVPIGGLEPVAAEQQIARAGMERGIYRQPAVTLIITEHATNRVTVLGAVSKPGVVSLPRSSCDLASALAAAGGLSTDAGTKVEVLHRGGSRLAAGQQPKRSGGDTTGVKLASFNDPMSSSVDPAPEVTRIDLAQAGGDGPENRKLDDRDVVMVPPQVKRVIHVTGLVKKPDQFTLTRDKDIHVLDAIAMAGGTTSPVADKVFIIRHLPNMPEPAVIKISIFMAKRNGDENLRLAAGDLVSVENTMATMAVDTVGKFFRVALGLNGSVSAF